MNNEPGIYRVSEQQFNILSMCIDSWRSSTFWTLMYLQSFLFKASNVSNIEKEVRDQPTQYEKIFEHYYGKEYSLLFSTNPYDPSSFLKRYLEALIAKQRRGASDVKKSWHDYVAYVAERFGMLNPYWNASIWETMLTHYIDLICESADNDLLGKYQEIGDEYLILDRLASEMGTYMATGIIRQFNIN